MSDVKEKGQINHKLHEEFFAHLEMKKISQSNVSVQLDVSGGMLSAYKSKTYAGDVSTLEKKIVSWMERQKRILDKCDIAYIETTITKNIHKAIDIASDDQDIVIITGSAGTGKTSAIKEYVKNNSSTIFIEVDPSFTKNVLVREIATRLEISGKGNSNTLLQQIITKLKGTGWTIIIDEADYLNGSSLEILRRMSDKAGIGIVLVGLPRLEGNIVGIKEDHDQIKSRIGTVLRIEKIKKEDAERIVKSVFKSVPNDVISELYKKSKSCIRTLIKLIQKTYRIMTENNLSVPDIETVTLASEVVFS